MAAAGVTTMEASYLAPWLPDSNATQQTTTKAKQSTVISCQLWRCSWLWIAMEMFYTGTDEQHFRANPPGRKKSEPPKMTSIVSQHYCLSMLHTGSLCSYYKVIIALIIIIVIQFHTLMTVAGWCWWHVAVGFFNLGCTFFLQEI